MRKRFRLAGLSLALALLVTGCTGDEPGEVEAGTTFSPAPEVSNPLGECARNTKIGVEYDAASQSAFENGLTLAADQLNQRGSFNYEPVLERETTELAADDEIAAIVSSNRAEAAAAAAAVATEAGVALILVGASSDEADLGDGVFSLRLSAEGEVEALKDVATEELKFKDVKVLTGSDVLVEKQGDYVLAPVPGQNPEALMQGIVEITGPDQVVGSSVYAFTDTGTIPDGVHIGVPWYTDAPESINADFVLAYEDAFGAKPTIDAAYGYTSVLLIARAVEDRCSNARDDIIKGLASTDDAASVFGSFSLAKNGEPSHRMFLLKIKNGTPTPP